MINFVFFFHWDSKPRYILSRLKAKYYLKDIIIVFRNISYGSGSFLVDFIQYVNNIGLYTPAQNYQQTNKHQILIEAHQEASRPIKYIPGINIDDLKIYCFFYIIALIFYFPTFT